MAKTKQNVRNYWDRVRVQASCAGKGKTQQNHKQSVDVNHIIKRFDRTGQLPPATVQGVYGDVSDLNAYYGEIVAQAKENIAAAEAFFAEQKRIQQEKAEAGKPTDPPPADPPSETKE